jgi:hypothetical protein
MAFCPERAVFGLAPRGKSNKILVFWYYGPNVPPKITVKTYPPYNVLRAEAFGRWLCHRSGSLVNGIREKTAIHDPGYEPLPDMRLPGV